MGDLHVELYGQPVGMLVGPDWRSFDFQADRKAIEYFELGSTVLSESIPLSVVAPRSKAGRRRNFFAELLPEGRALTNLATRIGVSESDVLGLLAQYGRDVAGAVQLYDPSRPDEPRTPHATELTVRDVRNLLVNAQGFPLGNMPVSGKTSLAGVQDKIVLARIDDVWHQVHDGHPSTHIVKPESRELPTAIFDEEYGARAARTLRLAETATWVSQFDDTAGLVIERYDRDRDSPQGRIHQEDMNQALGARANQKYQEHGGVVSLRRIAEILRKNGDTNSLERLLRMTVLAVAIGNVDMHAKNISLLHHPDGSSTLAPTYDMVPMRHQHNDGRMALSVNGIYPHSHITAADLVAEAESWRMRGPQPLVERALEEVAAFAAAEVPDTRAHRFLRDDVSRFTRHLLDGKPAGEPA